MRNHLSLRNSALQVMFLSMFSAMIHSGDLFAQANQKPAPPLVREIFVPFSELETLLESQARRVYMKRKEYADLLKQAVKQAPNEPPHAAAIVSADFQIALADGRASITGVLDIDVLKPGPVAVQLPLDGAGIRQATLDSQPAALARNASGATLFVNGVGSHQLKLRLNAVVETEAAQQTITLGLPRAASAKIAMSVPGNVEIKGGASVISRRVDEAANVTYFELVAWSGSKRITMSLNNRRLRDDQAMVCRSVVVDELTQAYERLHITSSFQVLHGAVETLRFAAPKGWEISSVESELLARWSVSEEDDRQVVEAILRKPVRGFVACNILASRTSPDLAAWQMPQWTPLDTVGNVAVVGLLLENRLKPQSLSSNNVLAIDSTILAEALPESILKFEPGQPQIRPAVAYYAPQGLYEINGEIRKPPARLDVVNSILLTARDESLRIDGAITLLPYVERRFEADITAPQGWRITKISSEDLKPIPFETAAAVDGDPRWRIRLPKALTPGTPFTFLIQAELEDGGEWLGGWTEKTVELPQFNVLDAKKQIGSVAVQLGDDLVVQPGNGMGLSTLDDRQALMRFGDADAALAYRFEGDYQMPLSFRRQEPYVSARSYSFINLEPNRLATHLELQFSVQHARVRQLQFSLPKSTPQVISIRGLGGVKVKESHSEENGEVRVWTAELTAPRDGAISLAVDFEETWEGEPAAKMSPAAPTLISAAYQTGVVAVEGDARLDIQIDTDARVVDVGELAAADYLPGRRLLGAFEYIGAPGQFDVNIKRRTGREIPTAIIERAEIVSVIGANGRCQTVARMQLNSKAAFLEMRMPEGAKLWSVLVDAQPITPQRSGAQLLISLPSSMSTKRSLQVVYETSIDAFNGFGRFDVRGPVLYVRTDEGDSASRDPIPTADLQWRILPPSGYRLTRPTGAVFRQRPAHWTPYNWLSQFDRMVTPAFEQTMMVAESPMSPHAFDMAPGAEMDNALASNGAVEESKLEEIEQFSQSAAKRPAFAADPAAATPAPTADMPQEAPPTAEPPKAGGKPVNQTRQAGMPLNPNLPAPPSDGGAGPGGSGLGGGGMGGGIGGVGGGVAAGAAGDSQPGQPGSVIAQAGDPGSPRDAADSDGDVGGQGRRDLAWALAGLRSLPIDMQRTLAQSDNDDLVAFQGLGAEPELSAELVSQQRLDAVAWAWGLLVFAIGVGLTRASLTVKLRLIILTASLSVLAPLVVNELDILGPVGFCSFVAAVALIPYYLLARLCQWFVGAGHRFFRPATDAALTASLMLVLFASSASAQQPKSPNWEGLFNRLANPRTVAIPKNAVVIPYRLDPEGNLQASIDAADQVLIPYDTYVRLWNQAHPDEQIAGPIQQRAYAFAGAVYTTKLVDQDQILIQGELMVDVFTDQPTLAPLQLQGGVLSAASVDGQAARLHAMNAAQTSRQAMQQARVQQAANAVAQPPAPNSVLAVLLEGKGRKKIELTIRMRPERRGGWRMIGGRLPGDVSAALSLTAPNANTEIRIRGAFDRELFETTKANETIETALDSRQPLSLQWRPKVGETQVDRTLTAQSTAVWDVQDEGMRLTWNISLAFRQGRRDTFTFQAPLDYLVEQVVGDNVRAWRVQKQADHQRIDVTLLKAVALKTDFSLRLSKRGAVGAGELAEVSAPTVTAADAALHQGRIFIRRSPMLDVRVAEKRGVAQTDLDEGLIKKAIATNNGEGQSPLGVRSFQAFRFASTGYSIKLTAAPISVQTARLSAKWQTLIQMGADSARVEAMAQIDSGDFGLHHIVIQAPASLQVQRVEAESLLDWSASTTDQVQQVHLFFLAAQRGRFAVVIAGHFPNHAADQPLTIPNIALVSAKQNEGQIVVASETGFQIQPRNLNGIQAHPVRGSNSPTLRRVQNWLAAENRARTQWVLDFVSQTYGGELVTTPKAPKVTATTVSNVRVTDQTIEESILLRFKVSNAGVRELAFSLPATMANARIQAPSLRRKTVAPVVGDDSQVEIRLELQEQILGEIVVVVEQDRLHGDARQVVPIPRIRSAESETFQQYITLENASRDELVIATQNGIEPLSRRTPPPELAGVNLNRAYAVRENPLLEYESKSRDEVATAGARIELAEARLALDAAGVYRGEQLYHIDNRTEQYLEVELPAGANLWTAIVANEPVKPSRSAKGERFVRIPLVKTAVGDPNYTIRLQYGGQLGRLRGWSSIDFPLIRTDNVNVELSQVRLFLPESYRWGGFGGSMRQVDDEAVFVKGYANYIRQQIGKASEALTSKNAYRRARAANNLKQLGLALQSYRASEGRYDSSVQAEFAGNLEALREAEQQIDGLAANDAANLSFDNRGKFNDFYDEQSNTIAGVQAAELGANFSGKAITKFNSATSKDGKGFDRAWLDRNKLGNQKLQQSAAEGKKNTRILLDASEKHAIDQVKDLISKGQGLNRLSTAKPSSGKPEQAEAQQLKARRATNSARSNQELANRYQKRLEDQTRMRINDSEGEGQNAAAETGAFNARRSRLTNDLPSPARSRFKDDNELAQVDSPDARPMDSPNRRGELAGKLASLDVSLPMRGVEVRFTTPRGDVKITGRGVSRSMLGRFTSISIIVVLLIGWLALQRVAQRWFPQLAS